MKIGGEKVQVGLLRLAAQGVLAAMCATPMMAAGDDATASAKPTGSIEVGVGYVSDDSAKFGEYNGLNNKGGVFLGNFGLRGGDAYAPGNGTMRWNLYGTDLGTTARTLGGSMGNQGKWDLSIGYDELRHNITDTYQTPQQGSMGGNSFTFPPTFGTFNTQANPATRSLNATQLGAFHTEDVSSTRQNYSLGAGFYFNPQLSVRFDYNRLDQSGAKLQGFGNQGGVTIASGIGRAEAVAILMNPTSYKTDTYNLALNWAGDKGHLSASYFASIFKDDNNSLSWQNAGLQTTGFVGCASGGSCAYQTNFASTMPSNEFHQLNLSGGYAFTPSTKLAGGLSYGRNTQNDGYAPYAVMQAGIGVLPQSSLDGKVITRHADVKLTNQTTQDLVLSAAYKYNERENKTSSNTYLYNDLGNAAYTGVNTPYSNRKTQFELAGTYRITKDQSLRAAYEREDVKRWCDGVVGGAQCLVSPSSNEDKLGLTYRLRVNESVRLNAQYAYAKRDANYDHLFSANTGIYPVTNAADVVGFVAAPYVTRKQDYLKAGVNWRATEALDVGVNARGSKDNYSTALGVQDGKSQSLNLDATYSYSDSASVSAYASWQNRDRGMQNAANGNVTTAPTQVWTNQLKEDGYAIGLSAKKSGLMGGKLELTGDLSYSLDKSHYATQQPYSATCSGATVLSCVDTPDVKSELVIFKLTGSYQLDKVSKVVLAYWYQNLKSDDYFYNGYQYGYTPNRVMPTNQVAPRYSVNVFGASYVYNFQ